MNKKTLIILLTCVSCVFSSYAKKQMNVLYVFPDQQRKHALSFWNDKEFKNAIRTQADPVSTPNVDMLAHESVVLTNAVSNFPLCSPHRGSMLSGTYPNVSGVSLNCNSNRPVSSLREDLECLTDVLHKADYQQAYFGKWHMDFPTPNDPANPGNYVDPRMPAWDTYSPNAKRHSVETWYSYGTWDVHKDPHYYDTEGKRYEPKEWSPKHEADKVIEYLENKEAKRDEDKPFAIFVSMNPPHNPYKSLDDCLEEDYDMYKGMSSKKLLGRKNVNLDLEKVESAPYYFAMVTGVDREFGRIIAQLKAMGEYENTLIVYTSDHGETMCSQNTKDPKNSIYTESFDVPFIIRHPELEKKARIDDLMMGTPDIMPTMLGMLGLQDMIPTTVQGTNYADIILSEESKQERPKSALYIRNVDGEKNDKSQAVSYFPVARGVKTHQYTFEITINRKGKMMSTKFFNDEKDPYQLKNMEVDMDDPIVKELLQEMAYWLKKSNDPWYTDKRLSEFVPYN